MRRLFYFDCHIGVFRELEYLVSKLLPDSSFEGWLISGHAHLLGRTADEVRVVNSASWRHLDARMIQEFRSIYDDYLQRFEEALIKMGF